MQNGQITFGAAAELSARIFNGMLEIDEQTTSIGTTQSRLLAEDGERVSYLLINLSPNRIFASFDNTVSSSRGIVLSANGGFFSMNAKDDFTIVARPIHVIADVAASNLYHFSQRRYKALPEELKAIGVAGIL